MTQRLTNPPYRQQAPSVRSLYTQYCSTVNVLHYLARRQWDETLADLGAAADRARLARTGLAVGEHCRVVALVKGCWRRLGYALVVCACVLGVAAAAADFTIAS